MINIFIKLGTKAARRYLSTVNAPTKAGKIAAKAWSKKYGVSKTTLNQMARQRLAMQSHKATGGSVAKQRLKDSMKKEW
jgi:DNA-binding transcriptional regulator YdaS (Cro superfamily)